MGVNTLLVAAPGFWLIREIELVPRCHLRIEPTVTASRFTLSHRLGYPAKVATMSPFKVPIDGPSKMLSSSVQLGST